MNKKILFSLALAFSLILPAVAAPNTYQVTGPILEVTDSMIAVQKGKERWEIARDAKTKVTGDLKVGSKITIEYTMSATTITAKLEKAEKAAAKPSASPKK